MNSSISIDNSLTYEILKYVDSSPVGFVTLRDLVDNTCLSDYDSGSTAISTLCNIGLLAGKYDNGNIFVSLDSSGKGKLFLDNYKYISRLTSSDKWKERIWSFISGIAAGVIISTVVFYFGLI